MGGVSLEESSKGKNILDIRNECKGKHEARVSLVPVENRLSAAAAAAGLGAKW